MIVTQPRLNVGLTTFGRAAEPDALLHAADCADAAGIDALTVFDHVVLGGDLDKYPWGQFPGGPEVPWLEPMTLLAAIAGRTSRIRLATGVLIAPLRGAAVLAKSAATLDLISGGRLDLGVGTGWLDKEYEAVGMDFAARGALLTDTLAACQALWQGGPTAFESASISFTDVWCHPTPVQAGGVPFWISGALHRRNLDRIVRFGSGWLPSPSAPADEVRQGIAVLREALPRAGRDPQSVRVRISLPVIRDGHKRPLLRQSFEEVPALLEAGATDVHTPLAAWERALGGTDQACAALAGAWRQQLG